MLGCPEVEERNPTVSVMDRCRRAEERFHQGRAQGRREDGCRVRVLALAPRFVKEVDFEPDGIRRFV